MILQRGELVIVNNKLCVVCSVKPLRVAHLYQLALDQTRRVSTWAPGGAVTQTLDDQPIFLAGVDGEYVATSEMSIWQTHSFYYAFASTDERAVRNVLYRAKGRRKYVIAMMSLRPGRAHFNLDKTALPFDLQIRNGFMFDIKR